MPAYDAREGNAKVRACIFCGDVLQQHIGNMNKTTEFARGLDFIVTIDPYFTEGASGPTSSCPPPRASRTTRRWGA